MTKGEVLSVIENNGFVWSMINNKPEKFKPWKPAGELGYFWVHRQTVGKPETLHGRWPQDLFPTKMSLRDHVFGTEMDILVEDPIF